MKVGSQHSIILNLLNSAAIFFALSFCGSVGYSEERLPPIEAKTYGVSVQKRSRSGRVVLLGANPESIPRPGRVLHLREGGPDPSNSNPSIAVQVLKVYADKNQFAAKIVRRYPNLPEIAPGSRYFAVEKVSDLASAPPVPTAQDRADLRELEKIEPPPGLTAPAVAVPTLPQITPPTVPTVTPPAAPALPRISSSALQTPQLPPQVAQAAQVAQAPPVQVPAVPPAAPNANEVDNMLNQMGGEPPAPPLDPATATGQALPDLPTDTASPPPPPGGESEPPPPEEVASQDEPAPEPAAPEVKDPELQDEDEDETRAHIVEEVEIYDRFVNWLTAGFGFFSNVDQNAQTAYYIGAGMRFAKTFSSLHWDRKSSYQGSWTIEGGAYFYKVLNFVSGSSDAYSVIPIIGTLRHNLRFTENFGIYIYAGILFNYVMVNSPGNLSEDTVNEAVSALRGGLGQYGIRPAGGVGFNFAVGPNWEARVDLGIDVVGLGLMLRF